MDQLLAEAPEDARGPLSVLVTRETAREPKAMGRQVLVGAIRIP